MQNTSAITHRIEPRIQDRVVGDLSPPGTIVTELYCGTAAVRIVPDSAGSNPPSLAAGKDMPTGWPAIHGRRNPTEHA